MIKKDENNLGVKMKISIEVEINLEKDFVKEKEFWYVMICLIIGYDFKLVYFWFFYKVGGMWLWEKYIIVVVWWLDGGVFGFG